MAKVKKKTANRKNKKKMSNTAKAILIVFILLFLTTVAVGLWHHWDDICVSDDKPEYIAIDPKHIYF